MRVMEPADSDFHARHSAISKTYVFRVLNSGIRSPLARLYAWHVPYSLDLRAMEAAAAAILGAHDFSAFGTGHRRHSVSTVREILHASWTADETSGFLTFTVRGTGFLGYMVRSLVGTMVAVGRGKISLTGFSGILRSRDRNRGGPTAPALGLCLERVHYEDHALRGEEKTPGERGFPKRIHGRRRQRPTMKVRNFNKTLPSPWPEPPQV